MPDAYVKGGQVNRDQNIFWRLKKKSIPRIHTNSTTKSWNQDVCYFLSQTNSRSDEDYAKMGYRSK